MKQRNKKRLAAIGIYFGFAASLAGSVCGTFAWYTYGMRVPITYKGSSIGDYGSLEVGLVSQVKLTTAECEQFALISDYSTGLNIYWSQGSIGSDTLAFIQKKNGYAHDYLRPITAGRFEGKPGEKVMLRNSPAYCKTYRGQVYDGQVVQANKDDYTKLDLAFRYKGDESSGSYSENYKVYLSSASVVSDKADEKIAKGVRMYLEGEDIEGNDKSLLIDPNATSPKTLITGGPLDLNNDGYYDTIERADINHYETFAYGEFEGRGIDLFYNEEPTPGDGIAPTDEQILSTFDAKPRPDAFEIDETISTYPTVRYESYLTAIDKSKFVLATPNSYYRYYAFGSVTIYLEGWDHNVDNAEVLHNFSFDLLFEAI